MQRLSKQPAPIKESHTDGEYKIFSRPWIRWFQDLTQNFVTTFLDLQDTPSSYSGQSGQAVIVNGTEDGLEFGSAGVETYDELTDTPASKVGASLDLVRVNAGETAHEYVDKSALGLDHLTDIANVGTNTHDQIDTHIADGTIHFTEASIDHLNIQNIGTNSHAQIDAHIANGDIHKTEFDETEHTYTGLEETGIVRKLATATVESFTVAYNTAGDPTSVTDGINTWTYTYNGLGQLTGTVKT